MRYEGYNDRSLENSREWWLDTLGQPAWDVLGQKRWPATQKRAVPLKRVRKDSKSLSSPRLCQSKVTGPVPWSQYSEKAYRRAAN